MVYLQCSYILNENQTENTIFSGEESSCIARYVLPRNKMWKYLWLTLHIIHPMIIAEIISFFITFYGNEKSFSGGFYSFFCCCCIARNTLNVIQSIISLHSNDLGLWWIVGAYNVLIIMPNILAISSCKDEYTVREKDMQNAWKMMFCNSFRQSYQ